MIYPALVMTPVFLPVLRFKIFLYRRIMYRSGPDAPILILL